MFKACLLNSTLENQNGLSLTLFYPPAKNDQYFFSCIDKALDTYSNYDNVLLEGGFNTEDDQLCMSNFSISIISITSLR